MPLSGSITRRSLLSASASAALPLAGVTFGGHYDMARGRVLEMDAAPPRGIPGVLVSNGVEVVQTDADGAYELPIRDGVFLIKPAHWSLPLDVHTGVPSFSYMHRPFGSPPSLAHGGLAPTGQVPEAIDFVLRRHPEPKAFTAVLLADPQPSNSEEFNFLRRAMDKICSKDQFAFVIALGDIASDNLSIYDEYQRQAARLGTPVWHIPGNHDHDMDATDTRFRLETWRAKFGPPTYAFEHSGALFVMLDNVRVTPGGYKGEIGPAGLAFVRNLLAFTPRETLVVVCTHIPLTSSHADDPSCTTADTKALLSLLAGRRAVSFSGHMHTSEHHYLPTSGGIHHHQIITALSGSWWSGPFDAFGQPFSVSSDGSPYGWYELSVNGSEHYTSFVSGRDSAVARAILPNFGDADAVGAMIETVGAYSSKTDILVNVFDGGPRTKVWIEVADHRHILDRVHATDPYVIDLYRQAGKSLKYWVRPEASSHLWALAGSTLPADALAAARLTIIDEFGRIKVKDTQLVKMTA